MIERLKTVAKRHWPALRLRTILLATFVLVAALPGVGAVFLRVYENTLVQQTEAELVAQSAILASAAGIAWTEGPRQQREPTPEPPAIDLRVDRVLPPQPPAQRAGVADRDAVRVGRVIARIVNDAASTTLSATRLLDARGIVVVGREDLGLSYAGLPEVKRALGGNVATVLRARTEEPYGIRSPITLLSRASAIRVHHVRPVIVDDRVVGVVMLSRSPRGLFLGIYQDRGKIMLGVLMILATVIVLAGLLSRGIARPIRALAVATTDVARGGTIIPEAPSTAAIEIRELYANFALMAQRIDQRTRYLRDFATAMSHELKTPLTGIRGALELVSDHEDTMRPTERRQFIANAMADTERLSNLVKRILALSRADLAIATENPRSEVVAIVRAFASDDSAGAPSVHIVSSEADAIARIAPDTLATVLGILIENSRQARATFVTIAVETAGQNILVTVSDNGDGIAGADHERIFEAFFTGRRDTGGTGLGLSIARSLLEVTSAELALKPRTEGACFVIIIPRADDD